MWWWGCTMVEGAEDRSANAWSRLGDGPPGERTGSVLVFARDSNRLLLFGGEYQGAGPVQGFDPATTQWSEFSTNRVKGQFHPYYQAAYYPKDRTVFCLSNGSILYRFNTEERAWKAMAPAPALEGLSWHVLACDPEAGRLVAVGADKRIENVGWTRTVIYDIAAGKWETLPPPDEKVLNEHHDLVAAIEATIDLVGRSRLAWYRDPQGTGKEAELKALAQRCDRLANLPGMAAFQADLGPVIEALKARKTLGP